LLPRLVGVHQPTKETIMPKALVVATTTFAMLSPAFENPSYEAEWGLGTYPSAGECHFITQQTVTPTGHRVHEQHQVCN
jgi:hypothetical protein